MSITRRHLLTALLAASPAALLLTGCPGAKPGGEKPGGETKTGGSAAGGKALKVGLVTDTGGVGDRSFNAAAWEGLERAAKEWGVQPKYTESRQAADYVGNLSRYAQNGYDLVFAVGYLMQDALAEVAPRFPNVKFAIVDGDAPDRENCVALKFREEEGSFLAGALAGLVTRTDTIGFVGGMKGALIERFEVGYRAGAMTTNPKIRVRVGYAGSWIDPQKGQEIALSQIGSGADILYHAAGQTGLGVIKAAQNKGEGCYAIGVDRDQDDIAPGRVLTSMVKRVDNAVFDICREVRDGAFRSGTRVFGLKEDGVGLSEMKYTRKDVPPEALARVESLKARIVSGELKPPATLAELESFRAPK